MPQDPNLPAGCTNQDTDGGVTIQPSDEAIHKYVCEHWRLLLDEDVGFDKVDMLGSFDASLEETEIFITVRVSVSWADVEK